MARQQGKEPELWIKDVQKLLGIDRRVIQDYTEKGIIQPAVSAVRQGGRNIYGKLQLVELAVAKALSELGVRLMDIANFFNSIRGTKTMVQIYTGEESLNSKLLQHKQALEFTYPAELVCFDPIPSENEVVDALWDRETNRTPPNKPEDWMYYWSDVYQLISVSSWEFSHTIHQIIIPKYLASSMRGQHLPRQYDIWRRYTSNWLFTNTIRLQDMAEVSPAWIIDFARTKEKIAKLLLNSEWYESSPSILNDID